MGSDHLGPIVCKVINSGDDELSYDFGRAIARGTDLVFDCQFIEEDEYIQSCFLDNRLGVYNALDLAKVIDDGLIVFTCREEHGGGAMPLLVKYIYEKFELHQALISDITWVTSGVKHGDGLLYLFAMLVFPINNTFRGSSKQLLKAELISNWRLSPQVQVTPAKFNPVRIL